MKTIKKLGALAALVALSSSALQAVTVSLAGSYNGTSPYTDTGGNKFYGYYLSGDGVTSYPAPPSGSTPTWVQTNVTQTSFGLGVFSSNDGVPSQIEDLPESPFPTSGSTTQLSYNEFLVIDFGSNWANKSNLEIKYRVFSAGQYTYYWANTLPTSGVSTAPALGTVDANSLTFATTGLTSFLAVPGTMSQYLFLGATSPTSFSVNSIQYTQVPDGGLTVTLLGAALGSLGFVGFRRRKA
jgi:hypothetical protein